MDLIFRQARTHSVWLDKSVEDELLKKVHDLARMGPTSANMCPMRIIFAKSRDAKEMLEPALDEGNVDKTHEGSRHCYHRYGHLLLREDARSWFKDLPENVLEHIALRNSSL